MRHHHSQEPTSTIDRGQQSKYLPSFYIAFDDQWYMSQPAPQAYSLRHMCMTMPAGPTPSSQLWSKEPAATPKVCSQASIGSCMQAWADTTSSAWTGREEGKRGRHQAADLQVRLASDLEAPIARTAVEDGVQQARVCVAAHIGHSSAGRPAVGGRERI